MNLLKVTTDAPDFQTYLKNQLNYLLKKVSFYLWSWLCLFIQLKDLKLNFDECLFTNLIVFRVNNAKQKFKANCKLVVLLGTKRAKIDLIFKLHIKTWKLDKWAILKELQMSRDLSKKWQIWLKISKLAARQPSTTLNPKFQLHPKIRFRNKTTTQILAKTITPKNRKKTNQNQVWTPQYFNLLKKRS